MVLNCADNLETEKVSRIDLSSLPHLRHLIIHAEIYFWYDDDLTDGLTCTSYLPKAIEIFETASSLQRLTIEIYVDPSWINFDDISLLNLSPLKVLTKSPVRCPHIDLYMYTGSPQLPITHTLIGSWLAKHEGLMELVEQGVLVVHPEEFAPTLSRSYIAKENNEPCIIM